MSAAVAYHDVPYYPRQYDFIADERRYACFLAGRNSGKTYAGATKAALRCLEPGLGIIAAPDFPMLEFGAKRQFKERLDELGMRFFEHKSLNTLTIPATGAEVVFATLENEGRIRGPNYHWAWPDELEYISHRQSWLTLKGAVRAGSHPQIFPTTTPQGRRLVWEEWVRDGDERHALYTASTFDNPFIDAGEYVRALGYSGQFYAQEIEAQFVAFEGLVYPQFDRLTHVQRVETSGWGTALGLDVGFRNPTAILVAKHSGERLHLAAEHYQSGLAASEMVAQTAALYAAHEASFVVIDPAAAELVPDLQRAGLKVRRAQHDRLVGVARCQTILPTLTVDPGCTQFLAEIETYHYPERQGERDDPVKEHDHLMDAWRYLVMDLFGPRKQVRFL